MKMSDVNLEHLKGRNWRTKISFIFTQLNMFLVIFFQSTFKRAILFAHFIILSSYLSCASLPAYFYPQLIMFAVGLFLINE